MATTPTQPDPLDASNPSRPGDASRPSRWTRFRRLPRTLRVTTYVAVALVLVLVAGALTGTMLVRRSFPETSGTVELPGLDADVRVLRDDHGIPQIYADTTEDLMAAQGYVHAQERFFEMDVRRHVTAGRLAELFGADAVETDAFVRTMGWRRVAERELGLLAPGTRTALDAYADGVNAYLKDRSPSEISLEYTVLGAGGLDYQPAKWDAVDSLAWLKAMAWDLRGNMEEEIQRALAVGAVGTERAEELWPTYDYAEHPPIVDQGAVVDGVFEQDATAGGTRNPVRPPPFGGAALRELAGLGRSLGRMPALLGRGDGIGSNSWVVSGDRTATGAPMLANDPHLGVSLPGIWMQVGLHCNEVSEACPYDVAGFSFSGVPGVVIGHNADIAWGFTNQGTDVSDLYLERLRGDEWRQGRTWQPLETRRETIEVAGGDDVEITVRSTAHGPLLSDADDAVDGVLDDVAGDPRADDEEIGVALQWTALRPAPTMDAVLDLNRADDWNSFRSAAADLAAPAQNIVYADREGHIGYQATGTTPIRKSGHDGRMPVAGWLPENDWTGEFVPFDGLPNVLDPDSGVVVTANQAVSRPSYSYLLTEDYDVGFRSSRISELLADRDDLTADDLLAVQRDDRNPMAPVLVPHLLDLRLARGYFSDGQRVLEDWDFRQPASGAGSPAAAYYNAVWRNLLRLTFHDELPEGGRARRRRPLDGGRDRPARGAGQRLVGRHRDRRGGAARRRPARRPSATPATSSPHGRRSTPTSGRGADCTPSSCGARPSASPASGWSRRSSTAGAGTSPAAARSSTPPRGTPARATRSRRRRRCGWSSTSTTSTRPAGSTSPASPATPSTTTTPTRPISSSPATPSPGRSPATRWRPRPRTS